MKKLLYILAGVILGAPLVAFAVNVSVPASASYGQLLIGNASGGSYTPTATSSTKFFTVTTTGTSGAATYSAGTLNIPQYSGSSGGSGLATTSPTASSNLLEYSASGAGSAFGVATSSVTYSSPFTTSGTAGYIVGGSAFTLGLDTSGTWTGNAGSATKLATARAINGVNFDGTAAITVASTTLLGDSNTFTKLNSFSNATSTLFSAGTAWLTGITGTTQCLHVDTNGKISGTGSDCGSSGGSVTGVTATYPILSSGGTAPVISTAFGTTTSWGIGNDQLIYTSHTGVPLGVASSSLNLPNAALANSTISGIALGSNLAALTATDATLTFSGSYNGSTARTVGINLANANSWSSKQTFANASSTLQSVATELNIPNAASSPTLTTGDIALDTTQASSSLRFNDGTLTRALFDFTDKPTIYASSTLQYDGAWASAGTTTYNTWNPSHAVQLTSIYCKTDSGTTNYEVGNGSASSTVICTTGGAVSNTTVSFTLRQNVYEALGDTTGTPNRITVTPSYRFTAD